MNPNLNDKHDKRREVNNVERGASLKWIYQRINIYHRELVRFCQKWQISQLAVFGSGIVLYEQG